MKNPKISKRGSALLLILSICVVLAVLTAAVGVGTIGNMKAIAGQTQDEQTRFIASAGIQSALARLSEPRSWPTSGSPYGQGNAWSLADYNYNYDHLGLWSTTNDRIHAQVLVYNNTDAAFYRSGSGPDGVAIPSGKVLVVSKGLVEGDQRGERQSTTLMALVKPVGVTFDSAVAASGKVSILGTLVDAVDSNIAGWTPALYTPYDMTTTPTKAAKITSNSTTTDTIQFDGTSKIDGNVLSGPSSPLGAIGYYGATVTGTDGTLSNLKDMNNPIPADTTPELNGGGNVTYSAGATTLTAGTYKVSGNLTLVPGANLTVTGPTVLYVDGDFQANGATINMTGKPSDLQIFIIGGSAAAVDIDGTSASILLSSPESVATVNGSEVFGAVIGNEVNFTNSKLHYDQAVQNLVLGSNAWTIDSYVTHASTSDETITAPPGGPPSDPYATSGGSGTTSTSGTTGSSSSSGTSGSSSSSGTSGTTGSSSSSGTSGTTGSSSSSGTSGTTSSSSSSGTSGTTSSSSSSGTSGTTSSSSSSGTSGTTSSGSSSGSSTGSVRGAPKCCLDYSCGPPRCMLY